MLLNVLRSVRRTQPVGLVARTIPEMLCKRNPFYEGNGVFDLVRIRQVTGFIGYGFESVVNRQRAREDRPTDFVSEARSWGQRPRGRCEPGRGFRSPLVRHRGNWYLSLKRQRIVRTEHRRITTNALVHERELQSFLRPDDGRFEKKRQQLERPVIVRDYGLANIAHLTLDGTLYVMTPCPNTRLPETEAKDRNRSRRSCGDCSTTGAGRRPRQSQSDS